MPLVDDKQSYTLLSMDEKNGQTIMRFQRPIDTCDDQDFLIKVRHFNLFLQPNLTHWLKKLIMNHFD